MSDLNWIVEGVTQFVQSPLWTQPIQDFIDENCVIFGEADADENGAISTSLFGSDSKAASSTNSCKDLSPELIVIHKQFAELMDSVLTEYLDELGVDAAKALEVLQASTSPDAKNFIKLLLSLDDFPTFKTIMVKRNHELELEALRAIEKKIEDAKAREAERKLIEAKNAALNLPTNTHVNNNNNNRNDEEDEDLRQAIAMSLAEQEALKLKEAEMQDSELREALALSRAMEDERLAAFRAEQQAILDAIEQSKRDAANAAAAQAELARIEAETRARKAKAEAEYKLAQEHAAAIAKEAAAKRREIAERVSDIIIAREEKKAQQQQQQQQQQKSSDDNTPLAALSAPPPPPPVQENVASSTTTTTTTVEKAPATPPAETVSVPPPTTTTTTVTAKSVEETKVTTTATANATTASNTLPSFSTGSGLAPVGGLIPLGSSSTNVAGSFSIFSKLPSKKPSSEEKDVPLASLVAESINKKQAEKKTPTATTTTAQPESLSFNDKAPDAEELERRAAYLRSQRDAIIAKRKADREAEMNRYSGGRSDGASSANTGAASAGPENKDDTHNKGGSGKATDNVHAQLTQELARRFKPQ